MVIVFVYITVCALMAVYMMMYASNLRQVVARSIDHSQGVYAGEAALLHVYTQMYTSQLASGSPGTPSGTYHFPAVTGGELINAAVATTATGTGNYYQIRATVSNWQ